jgi:hypothetical protein
MKFENLSKQCLIYQQTLVCGTCENQLNLRCHKPCSKPKKLLKVFGPRAIAVTRGVAGFRTEWFQTQPFTAATPISIQFLQRRQNFLGVVTRPVCITDQAANFKPVCV